MTMSQEAVHRCLGSQEENPQPHTKVFNRWHDVPGALQPEILRACSPRLRERHPTLTQGGGLVPGPGGLRASPEHVGVGGCSKGRSHAPTKVPGASTQPEPQGAADRARQAEQPSPEPTAAPLRPAQQERRVSDGKTRHPPHQQHLGVLQCRQGWPHSPSLKLPPAWVGFNSLRTRRGQALAHAKENQPHGQHLPPPSARPRRSWALPPSEGWLAVPVSCGAPSLIQHRHRYAGVPRPTCGVPAPPLTSPGLRVSAAAPLPASRRSLRAPRVTPTVDHRRGGRGAGGR